MYFLTEIMLMRSSIVIIASMLLFFYSCGNNPTMPVNNYEPASAGILPLKVGNFWTYKTYVLNKDGSIKREYPPQAATGVFDYSSNWKNQNVSGFIWGSYFTDSTITRLPPSDVLDISWLYINKNDGLHIIGSSIDSIFAVVDFLQYKYPIKADESWLRPHFGFDIDMQSYTVADTQSVTCIDTAAIFDTPVGQFKCHVYRYIVPQGDDVSEWLEYNEYYKPGFGKVGSYVNSFFPSSNIRSYKYKMVLTATNVLIN